MTHSRRVCRNVRPCEPRSLQETLQCVVLHSDRDAASIAEAIGVRRGYLLDAVNPDRDELQFQARLISPVMHVADNLAPLRFWAREHRCALLELPRIDPSDTGIRRMFMKVMTNLGENTQAAEQALADGHVSPDEARRLVPEIAQTVERLLEVKALFEQRAEGYDDRVTESPVSQRSTK